MILKKKKKLLELLDTVKEAISMLDKKNDDRDVLVNDCIYAIELVLTWLESEKNKPVTMVNLVETIAITLKGINGKLDLICSHLVMHISESIEILQYKIQKDIETELNIVFMPYKISMWDSLETIYESAIKDENCIVKVVPIPYYEKDIDNKYSKYVYEGEHFSKHIEIQDYKSFNLELEEPDVIFIHNAYDDFNTITQVNERFFTKNLKCYTDMLVYVPYYIPTPITGENILYNIPSMQNIDKIIIASEFAEKTAINMGMHRDKILTLGTPKFDSIHKNINNPYQTNEWDNIIKDKKVVLLNTGCLFFSKNIIGANLFIENMFDLGRFLEGIVIIWRPHPLTASSIRKYIPEYYQEFEKKCDLIRNKSPYVRNIILDETDDCTTALNKADILLSDYSSLVNYFMLTEKPIMFLGVENSNQSLIPDDALYYYYDTKEPWYEFFKKFVYGNYDPLKKNRQGLAGKLYKNTDGTCGERILKAIKKEALNKINCGGYYE